jgi:phosphoethanolamine N-methyltransferase
LDHGQYSYEAIAKYEAVYGHNFISPGGLAMTQECLSLVELAPPITVLDIGCGLGGGAFYLAQQYGARVHGLDLSTNMLALARERCQALGLDALVTFTHGDILACDAVAMVDLAYSRDVFLHVHDKARLLQVLHRALKPKGVLLFTDYCRGEEEPSAEFAAYIAQRNYALCTVNAYRAWLAQAGFVDIVTQDRTAQFIQILEAELERIAQLPDDEHTRDELTQAWQSKLARAQRGEQRWGLCLARRPM